MFALIFSEEYIIREAYKIVFFFFVEQVWHVNGDEKVLLASSDQTKFYSGNCYIFQYTYSGEDKEEYLIGTWFGTKSVEVTSSFFWLV